MEMAFAITSFLTEDFKTNQILGARFDFLKLLNGGNFQPANQFIVTNRSLEASKLSAGTTLSEWMLLPAESTKVA